MTDIKLTVHADGSATMANAYGDTMDAGRTFNCDACRIEHPWVELHEVMARRHSTGEMVAVMWVGTTCTEGAPMRGEA